MSEKSSSHDLSTDLIFVPKGGPEPTDWITQHPNYVKIPATFVPHHKDPKQAASAVASKEIPHALPIAAASAVAVPAAEAWGATGVTEIGATALGLPIVAVAGALSLMIAPTESPEADNKRLDNRTAQPDLPPVPGTTMHDEPKPTPDKDGLVPPLPTPALPGFTPDTSSLLVLPGVYVDEIPPLILYQDRNKGLPPELRTSSSNARKAARAKDLEVTNALPAQDWQAHHLIGMASIKVNEDLVAAAARAGWRPDEQENIMALPSNSDAQIKLEARGLERPVHDNKHSIWTTNVSSYLDEITNKLRMKGYDVNSPEYEKAAREEMENLEQKLRQSALKKRRLTEQKIPSEAAIG